MMDKILNKDPSNEQQERVLNIYGIEFDWIFNDKEGSQFIKNLSQTENIEIFSVKLIVLILQFMWSFYYSRII